MAGWGNRVGGATWWLGGETEPEAPPGGWAGKQTQGGGGGSIMQPVRGPPLEYRGGGLEFF